MSRRTLLTLTVLNTLLVLVLFASIIRIKAKPESAQKPTIQQLSLDNENLDKLWGLILETSEFQTKIESLSKIPEDSEQASRLKKLQKLPTPANWDIIQQTRWKIEIFTKWAKAEGSLQEVLRAASAIVDNPAENIAYREEALKQTVILLSARLRTTPIPKDVNDDAKTIILWLTTLVRSKQSNSLPGTALLGLAILNQQYPTLSAQINLTEQVTVATKSPLTLLRQSALQTIANNQLPEFKDFVITTIQDPANNTELALAIFALGEIGSPEDLSTLSYVSPPTSEILWVVAQARENIGTKYHIQTNAFDDRQ